MWLVLESREREERTVLRITLSYMQNVILENFSIFNWIFGKKGTNLDRKFLSSLPHLSLHYNLVYCQCCYKSLQLLVFTIPPSNETLILSWMSIFISFQSQPAYPLLSFCPLLSVSLLCLTTRHSQSHHDLESHHWVSRVWSLDSNTDLHPAHYLLQLLGKEAQIAPP